MRAIRKVLKKKRMLTLSDIKMFTKGQSLKFCVRMSNHWDRKESQKWIQTFKGILYTIKWCFF